MHPEKWYNFQTVIHHTAVFVSLTVNCILIYLILHKSPKQLGYYKYLMVYISVMEMMYSIVDLMASPIIHSYGSAFLIIMKYRETIFSAKVAPILNAVWASFYGISIATFEIIFIYRYLVAIGSKILQKFNRKKLFLCFMYPILFGVVWALIIYFPCAQSPRTDDYIRNHILEVLDLKLEDIVYNGPHFYPKDDRGNKSVNFVAVGVIGVLWFLVASSIFIAAYFGIKCYLRITEMVRDNSMTFSRQTKALQFQLFSALVVQASIPIVLMHIPVLIVYTFTLFDTELGSASGIVAVTISMFPALDPFPNLFLIKSYRKALLEYLRRIVCCTARPIAKPKITYQQEVRAMSGGTEISNTTRQQNQLDIEGIM